MLGFQYRFTSALPHHIKGTIELRALLLSQTDTWQNLSIVKKSTSFVGDTTLLVSSLPLSGLYPLINSVSAQSGTVGADYSADLQPVIHITGTVGPKSINETFAPALPFAIAPSVITLNATTAPAPPGATYIAPTASSELASALHPVLTGSIPHVVPNVISVAKYQFQIPLLRVLGFVFAGLALLFAIVHDTLRRRRTMRSDEEQIASRLHSLIVPVDSLGLSLTSNEIPVANFTHLARLAHFLERPILYELKQNTGTYAVDDETHRYVYRLSEASAPGELHPETLDPSDAPVVRPSSSSRSRDRRRRVTAVRGGTAVVVLAVIVTLSTSFTANTNVPVSKAGSSVHAQSVAELTPTGCSSLALTALVHGTGTFSNSRSHVLIIGSSGVDTITDTGSANCIVGGGGKDSVTGTATDICIIGPTFGATYKKCSTST